jgi:hypothetical protein
MESRTFNDLWWIQKWSPFNIHDINTVTVPSDQIYAFICFKCYNTYMSKPQDAIGDKYCVCSLARPISAFSIPEPREVPRETPHEVP